MVRSNQQGGIYMSYLPRRRRLKFMLRTRLLFKQRLHRLPNLFTLGNAFFGFASIIFASNGDLVPAAYFILFGAFFDALDGRIARIMGTTSALGEQLDSLCDAISFCLAPAFLVYHWELFRIGALGFMASSVFLLAGLVRLARFNITKSEQSIFFLGVPSTVAGCFLATISLTTGSLATKPYFMGCLLTMMVLLAYLMVSSIRFPTFKYVSKWWYAFSVILLIMCVTTLGFIKMLLGLFLFYFLFAFEETLRAKYLSSKCYTKRMRKNLLM